MNRQSLVIRELSLSETESPIRLHQYWDAHLHSGRLGILVAQYQGLLMHDAV
jgi:hypothetical protein